MTITQNTESMLNPQAQVVRSRLRKTRDKLSSLARTGQFLPGVDAEIARVDSILDNAEAQQQKTHPKKKAEELSQSVDAWTTYLDLLTKWRSEVQLAQGSGRMRTGLPRQEEEELEVSPGVPATQADFEAELQRRRQKRRM